jgi:hypothetical protein
MRHDGEEDSYQLGARDHLSEDRKSQSNRRRTDRGKAVSESDSLLSLSTYPGYWRRAAAGAARSMSNVTNGVFEDVRASTSPEGLMIHPTPPPAPLESTLLDDRLNAPERTAATTPTDNHFAVVVAAVARGGE